MSDFSTGYKADVAKWITAAQLCKAATTHGKKKTPAAEINAEINRLRALAEDTFKAFEVAGNVPDLKDFKKAFNIANGRQVAPEIVTQKSFFECFDEFCHENGRQRTDSTYKKFHTLKAHLQAFRPDIDFGDLNEAGLTQFIDYLRSIPIPSKKKKSTKGGEKIYQRLECATVRLGNCLDLSDGFCDGHRVKVTIRTPTILPIVLK
ncbi:phage integrase SAM-like domain-containing protein [Alistipes provencensis]|uniref:phage integrase SAM-like domain-containing protein n=1 Tax=Alistipes provencensis TaxID=1816676 RepID=UPI000AC39A48|nr:phage integrase SAM-like domain-containing protein [Alistipes provencensis]